MITKKIISKIDQTLKTSFGTYLLVKGEVAEIEFRNEEQIESFISFGVIELAPAGTEVEKEIPVILRDENDNELPLSNGLERLQLANEINEYRLEDIIE